MPIQMTTFAQNDTNGNGQFSPLKRKVQPKKTATEYTDIFDMNNHRMGFKSSTDPIFIAYEYLDNQPISQLASSFVKDSVNGLINFVSKVVNG